MFLDVLTAQLPAAELELAVLAVSGARTAGAELGP